MDLIAKLGPYAPYIVSSYAVAGIILGAMILGSLAKAAKVKARLAALEARGLGLRD